MGFNYLFIFPPCYVARCASKAHHRLGSEIISWCLETSLFKTTFPGWSSLPTSFVSFLVFYIFFYLFLKTMSCFSGCLTSSASIQELFCGIYSALKCSFHEFVGEKVVSPSYFSAIFFPLWPGLVVVFSISFHFYAYFYFFFIFSVIYRLFSSVLFSLHMLEFLIVFLL